MYTNLRCYARYQAFWRQSSGAPSARTALTAPVARTCTRSTQLSLRSRAFCEPRCSYATHADGKNVVNIVEVGPRDGLQNEKGIVPVETKVELIERLGRAGLLTVEAGSFVSPKWVPQMAGTADVLLRTHQQPGVRYPVLVPNTRGLQDLLELLAANPSSTTSASTPRALPLTDEIAIFTAATDAFSKANTNCTVEESLARLAPVAELALSRGLRVRGYVSVVVVCPYSGRVDPEQVRRVTQSLLDMGCYEVSLGDTVGAATPADIRALLETVLRGGSVNVAKIAGHFHDTYGMGVANALASLELGVRTLDAAVGGLGGCPYSPGATGNVATEDILYALRGSQYTTPGAAEQRLEEIAEIGSWISAQLKRPNSSRVGRALEAKRERQRTMAQDVKAKL